MNKTVLLWLACCGLVPAFATSRASGAPRPNIFVILADDMGYRAPVTNLLKKL